MKKRYIVELSAEERECLEALVDDTRQAALRRRHSQILLLVDQAEFGSSLTDSEAAEQVGCTRRTVEQVRERCVMEGLHVALERKKHSRTRPRKLDGDGEAALVQLACSEAPEGYASWSLRLLSAKLVELEIVDSISNECVRQVLKKHHKTLEKGYVVYPAKAERRICVSDGMRTGNLQKSL
jgi:hypothetical protein